MPCVKCGLSACRHATVLPKIVARIASRHFRSALRLLECHHSLPHLLLLPYCVVVL